MGIIEKGEIQEIKKKLFKISVVQTVTHLTKCGLYEISYYENIYIM